MTAKTHTIPTTRTSRIWYIIAPLLTLLISVAFLWFGQYVWHYRSHIQTHDPTTYHLNSLVSYSIIGPAVLGVLFSVIALIRRTQHLRKG